MDFERKIEEEIDERIEQAREVERESTAWTGVMTTCNRCGQPCAYARHDTWKQCAHALKGELTITRRKLEQERKRTDKVDILYLADLAGMGKDRYRNHER